MSACTEIIELSKRYEILKNGCEIKEDIKTEARAQERYITYEKVKRYQIYHAQQKIKKYQALEDQQKINSMSNEELKSIMVSVISKYSWRVALFFCVFVIISTI
jgi:hypothetical protein